MNEILEPITEVVPEADVKPSKKTIAKNDGVTEVIPVAAEDAVTTRITPDGFAIPDLSLLVRSADTNPRTVAMREGEHQSIADTLVDTLGVLGVIVRCVGWVPGPTVTLYKLEIAQGTRLNRITSLSDDIALALAAPTIRILAPIPGEKYVGIEVPNSKRSSVTLGDCLPAQDEGEPLLLSIGKDVAGESITADLARMPHLLVGGTTGSGKSVALNAMLISILMRATPTEVRLILVDPKRVEMAQYNDVPHLYVPVVTEAKEAASALAWACAEMDRRLKVLQKAKVKDIQAYDKLLNSRKAPDWAEKMPYLVIVIDELADLMHVAAKEVEASIARLAGLARAAGIHLIVATQRPEANVITGLIKANIANRIAFSVATGMDSRIILDQPGAEKLTGLGDMLFSTPAWAKPKRIQGCYVSEKEIVAVTEFLKTQGTPEYHESILETELGTDGMILGVGGSDVDPMMWDAAELAISQGFGSTSSIQRRFRVGYARAGRIMDMLQEYGIVGPPDGSKPRELLVDAHALAQIKYAYDNPEADLDGEAIDTP
jgi:S-DNA-T family DNA segregation ATPase FtsK/SpoIIIE